MSTYQEQEKTYQWFHKALLILIGLLLIFVVVMTVRSCTQEPAVEKAHVEAPNFDLVQVEKGKAVITGRAGKETEVHVVSGDQEIGVEKTDVNGEFVFLPEKEFTAGIYEISLFVMTEDDQKIVSPKKAILTIPAGETDAIAVLIGKQKTQLIQAPKREKGTGDLGVNVVEYNLKEKFNIMGYGLAHQTVRIYINNTFLAETSVDNKGWWAWEGHTRLVRDKQYTLRIDMIDNEAKVIARIEKIFSTDVYQGRANLYVVQKGDCLWRIAKKEYGRGIDYVLIFKANKSQIRDPDLIYPNQLFKIPSNG